MKRCTTCQEEFADKFGFCPVDGTPLSQYANPTLSIDITPAPYDARPTTSTPMRNTLHGRLEKKTPAPPPQETPLSESVTVPFNAFVAQSFTANAETKPQEPQPANGNGTTPPVNLAKAATPSDVLAQRHDELRLTMLEDKGLVRRLSGELALVAHNSQLTWPEFKRAPLGFIKRSVAGYGAALWSAVSRPAVALGLLTAFVSLGLVVGGVVFAEKNPNAVQSLSKGLFWASIPAGLGVLAFLAFWVKRTGKAAAMSLVTALATVGLIVGAIALFDKGQTSSTMSKGWIAALSVGALALLGGLLVAWLKRERPEALGNTGLGGRYVTESGSSGNDLTAVVASLIFVALLGVGVYFGSGLTSRVSKEDLVVTDILEVPVEEKEIPKEEEKPKKEGAAGNNKGKGGGSKPKFEKPQGGGGGGRENETKPVSKGETPPMSEQPQVVVPKVQPPPQRPPLLPVMPTLKGDSALTRMPRNMDFGDPNSSATERSSGKGSGDGFGGGNGSGAGTGSGGGLGPGRGGNTGGGDNKPGGGGTGGGGEGAPPKPTPRPTPKPEVDRDRPHTTKEVTRKAVITSRPQPPYTEDARKNNITGTVAVRVLLGGNGSVQQVVALTRLPNGLTENALAAARRIQFTPAEKAGVKVSQWIQVEYSFNLY